MPAWTFPKELELAADITPAEWIEESLPKRPWGTVGAVIPPVFESYSGILHHEKHAQFEGEIPEEVLDRLIPALNSVGNGNDKCWFCLWEGWAQLSVLEGFAELPRVDTDGRRYLLLRGRLEDVRLLLERPVDNPPNIWWPESRAWCVATEIDLDYTLVGGSAELIHRIRGDDELETFPVSPEDVLPEPRGE